MIKRINKDLIPMKLHYFLFNAGTGPVQPFLSVYLRELGFSEVIVGVIYTILPICGMIAKPVCGGIADRFKAQKIMFLMGILITATAFLAINYAPELPKEQNVHFACDGDAVLDTSTKKMAQIDECLIKNLQQNTEDISCQMKCTMQENYWEIIEKYWNYSRTESSSLSTLEFTGIINNSRTININNVLFFELSHVVMPNGHKQQPLCPCGKDCHISTYCNAKCNNYHLNDFITKTLITDENVYDLYQFWVILFLMIAGWVGQAIVVSIGDAICFELLGDKPNRYGYQRLFGALGWGIFAVISGLLVDTFSEGTATKNYEAAFYLSLIILLLDFAVSWNLKNPQNQQSVNIIKDVIRQLTDFRIIVFLLWCIAIGMCTGLIWNFLFFLIEDLAKQQGCDSANWIKTLEGLVMAIQTLAGEMPFFFWSGKILKKITHINAMTLILLATGVRYVLYSVISNPWWFLPVELLNGITFGLFYACMASYASIVAPPGTEATMQGLVGAVFEGIGVSLGSLAGGVSYSTYGGPFTFKLFGVGALVLGVIHAIIQFLIKRRSNLDADYEARYAKAPEGDDQEGLTIFEE